MCQSHTALIPGLCSHLESNTNKTESRGSGTAQKFMTGKFCQLRNSYVRVSGGA